MGRSLDSPLSGPSSSGFNHALLSGRIWSINGERVGVVQDGTVVKSLYSESRLAGHGSLLHHPLTM